MAAAGKARPTPLDLKKMAEWPKLELHAEAAAAGAVLEARSASQLRVLTWNVWFDNLCAHQRQRALLQELLAAAPDVACLQEVLPSFATSLRECPELRGSYDISPQDVSPYGCLLLVRCDLQASFFEKQLPTNMARRFVYATCKGRCPGLLVITGHFESLNSPQVRKQQLQVAAKMLRGQARSVLCGDFNFDDTKTWGDWRQSSPAVPPEKLENHVLQEVLPEFADTWREARPEEPGHTFDGTLNPACCHDPEERMRYDRILASRRGLTTTAASLLGTEVMRGCEDMGLRPSDHFGLLVDLEVIARGEEEASNGRSSCAFA